MPEPTQIALIVGLGNPGTEYDRTRHNVGFMAIEQLSRLWSIQVSPERRFQGIYGEKKYPNRSPIRLLKPTTFMNLSGQSVRSLCDWYKLSPQSVLVIYDDMDLPLGKIRLRPSGSAGGHNGMKSIIQHLGTQDFPRLRIGIGSPQSKGVINHVLGKFTEAEIKVLPEIFQLTQSAIAAMEQEGLAKAMSLYNSLAVGLE
jgi:peptidyl-tRNA hydrolase, PTH1 family